MKHGQIATYLGDKALIQHPAELSDAHEKVSEWGLSRAAQGDLVTKPMRVRVSTDELETFKLCAKAVDLKESQFLSFLVSQSLTIISGEVVNVEYLNNDQSELFGEN